MNMFTGAAPVIVNIVGLFLARQVAKWGHLIKWDLVKKDLDDRVRAIVPGEMLDDVAVSVMNTLVDLVAEALSSGKPIDQAWVEAKQKAGLVG